MEHHTDGTALRVRVSHCQFPLGMTQDFQATDGKNQLDFKTDHFLNESTKNATYAKSLTIFPNNLPQL